MGELNKDATIKWLGEVAFPDVKSNQKNKNKGLIPRFHIHLSDAYYGGTKVSLARACGQLAEDGVLVKAFIKYPQDVSDVISEPDADGKRKVVDGRNKGLTVGKDGRLSTPIYWFKGDKDIPEWATKTRGDSFRSGEEWFQKNGFAPTTTRTAATTPTGFVPENDEPM